MAIGQRRHDRTRHAVARSYVDRPGRGGRPGHHPDRRRRRGGRQVIRTHGSDAVIGAGATVGPFAYLRPGTELGANGRIGTFVETKNAQIGAGSKIRTSIYVGDATIGEQSNIGASSVSSTTTA